MVRRARPEPADLEHDRAQLSRQEWIVIARYTNGESVESIASALNIAESTVYTYKHRAEDKLDGDQLTVMEEMLQQQQDAGRPENIVRIVENAADCLRGMGVDIAINIDESHE